MNFTDPDVAAYLRRLTDRFDEPVLLAMEALAEERDFPIVGRVVGSTLELLARAIGARRVFELGSGFGFSAYWFSRAVGGSGEVILTDTDPSNAERAQEFLTRAGLWAPCRFVVGDAVQALHATEGSFDVIYNDVDKEGYPAAFAAARERVRVGGLYLCDNVLWSGRVARGDDDPATRAIRAHNEAVCADPDFTSAIVPTRDGVMVALRLR
jgi:caffeoyl-CoA O-methyltransferase